VRYLQARADVPQGKQVSLPALDVPCGTYLQFVEVQIPKCGLLKSKVQECRRNEGYIFSSDVSMQGIML
jgi:hypothetical protein